MSTIIFFMLVAVVHCIGVPVAPPVPPKIGAVATGVYRNMFLEAGYAQNDIDFRLSAITKQLFEGNPSNESLLYDAEDKNVNGSYIWDVSDNDVRTEGMSYGMMAMVQLNQQANFDRIFRWYKKYMQHPQTDVRAGYASWHCQISGSSMDNNPASDGETFTVTSLIFATKRWGDAGAINYTTEASIIMNGMLDKENPPCGVQGCQSIVNMFGGANANDTSPHMVRFVPYAQAATYTDPSYHTPAFYEQWAVSPIGVPWGKYWVSVANTSRTYFRAAAHPVTSLTPDYSSFNGAPYGSGTTFSFDAWRSGRNVALDLAWYATDYDWQVGFCNRLHTFFRKLKTWPTYGNQFSLAGDQISGDHSPGLVAMNAVCALASNETIAWDFIEALWNTSTPSGRYRYYDGVLYLEAWLHLSGNFRAKW